MAKNSRFGVAPYITLDSTDVPSMDVYRDNKPSHFTNKLQSAIQLGGHNWEVGLVWARIPFSWRTVIEPVRFGLIVETLSSAQLEFSSREKYVGSTDPFTAKLHSDAFHLERYPINITGYIPYYFPAGFYPTRFAVGKRLEKELNQVLQGSKMNVRFFQRPEGPFGFTVVGGSLSLWTDNPWLLRDVLGFDLVQPPQPLEGAVIFGIEHLSDAVSRRQNMQPFEVYSSIELYCNAIAPYAMGSSYVPHMAAISSNGVEHGSDIEYHANPIVYYPVAKHHFKELEVKLAYRTGKLVEFKGDETDHVSVQLHFRQPIFGI